MIDGAREPQPPAAGCGSTSGAGNRRAKYRHLLDAELSLGPDEIAVLAVLMLRGPQTPGELKQRTERLHPFAGLDGRR